MTLYDFDPKEQEWESLSESIEFPNYHTIASSSLQATWWNCSSSESVFINVKLFGNSDID